MIGTIDRVSSPGTFPPDWLYCPCLTVVHCARNRTCQVSLGIFLSVPNIGRVVIDIIYVQDKQNGFIRVNHMKLNQMIEKGIINRDVLEIVSF
jgi:hypothetical protein